MPRNVSGNYDLPLPPVEPNTTVSSNWANTTLEDIEQALTDSLDRNGSGGMNAPFRVPDGTEAQPSFSFSSSTGSGMWVDLVHLGFSFQGDEKMQITAAGVVFTGSVGTIAFPGGDPDAPGISFTGDANTGIGSFGANEIQFVTAGVIRGEFDSNPGFYIGDSDVDGGASGVALYNRARIASSSTTQYGYLGDEMFSVSATSAAYSMYLSPRMPPSGVNYTFSLVEGLRIGTVALELNQTLHNIRAIQLDNQTAADTTNDGIYSLMSAGTGKHFINSVGTAPSYFEGPIGIGAEPASGVRLQVRNTDPAASPTFGTSDTIIAQSATSAGLTLHAGATGGTLSLNFAVGTVRTQGRITYTPGSDLLAFWTDEVARLEIDDDGVRSIEPIGAPGFYVNEATDGLIGIIEGTATGLAAATSYDSIVVDSTGNTGLSFMGGASSLQAVAFGNSGSTTAGGMFYSNVTDVLTLRADGVSLVHVGEPNVKILTDGTVSGGATPLTSADSLVIDGSGNTGMTFMGIATAVQSIRFGDLVDNDAGGVRYSHATDELSLIAATGTKLLAKATGVDITGALDVSGAATVDGALTVNGSVAGTGKVSQNTAAGLTVTAGTNTPSGTVGTVFYTRVGDVVSVWGRITPTYTAADAPSTFDLALPVSSALTSADQLAGTFAPQVPADFGKAVYGAIYGNATNDRATFSIRSSAAGAQACSFSFAYLVL